MRGSVWLMLGRAPPGRTSRLFRPAGGRPARVLPFGLACPPPPCPPALTRLARPHPAALRPAPAPPRFGTFGPPAPVRLRPV